MTSKNFWPSLMLDLRLLFHLHGLQYMIPTWFTSIVTRFSDFSFTNILLLHEHWRLQSSIFNRMGHAAC